MPEENEKLFSSTLEKSMTTEELSLRPTRFEDFPGQETIKERMQIHIQACSERNDPLEHFILSGPPGLGKTTLAYITAHVHEADIKTSSGPVIEKPGDLAGLLTSLQEGDILFIDEIHRLSTQVEEYLYSAMEDFFIDIMLDQGVGARSVRLTIPRFTLIGATTRLGQISAPLRSRFIQVHRLNYYNKEDLQKIITRSAGILNCKLTTDGAAQIARRSRGTARIANNLLRWARDYAQVRTKGIIDEDSADQALNMQDIDSNGLDEMDKRILLHIAENFNGGPVGVKNIAVAVSEEAGTIEEVYEPFLIQEGYLARTSQGRIITEKSWDILGLKAPRKTPTDNQQELPL